MKRTLKDTKNNTLISLQKITKRAIGNAWIYKTQTINSWNCPICYNMHKNPILGVFICEDCSDKTSEKIKLFEKDIEHDIDCQIDERMAT